MKNKMLLCLPLVLFCLFADAQQKISDKSASVSGNLANKEALLELESSSKGLLNARVALVQSTNSAPMAKHVAGMMVYNTATNMDVVPGLYYNDGVHWIFVTGGGSGSGKDGVAGPQGLAGFPGKDGVAGPQGIAGFAGKDGVAGPQGLAGFPGKDGVAGPQGLTGFPGKDGVAGSQGIAGFAGKDGIAGPQGLTGFPGKDGVAGSPGPAGLDGSTIKVDPNNPGHALITNADGSTTSLGLPVGPQGLTGFPGKDGVAGPQGLAGFPGKDGIAGPQGLTGFPGKDGVAGSPGPAGLGGSTIKVDPNNPGQALITNADGSTTSLVLPVGPQGLTGFPGKDGVAGPQGLAGFPGKDGIAGPQGLTGFPGKDGVAGSPGPAGLDGSTIKVDPNNPGQALITNADGSTTSLVLPVGPQGLAGFPGKDGIVGAQGLAGFPGKDGIAGPQGLAGFPGKDGIAGPEGLAGFPGKDGIAGPQGLTGFPGKDGVAGPQGLAGFPGKDGVAGSPGPAGLDGSTIKVDPNNPGQALITNADGSTTSLVLPVGPQGPAGPNGISSLSIEEPSPYPQVPGYASMPDDDMDPSEAMNRPAQGTNVREDYTRLLLFTSRTGVQDSISLPTIPWRVATTMAEAMQYDGDIFRIGKVGIGATGYFSMNRVAETLHIADGGIKIDNIFTSNYTVTSSNNVVVADAKGILKTMPLSALAAKPSIIRQVAGYGYTLRSEDETIIITDVAGSQPTIYMPNNFKGKKYTIKAVGFQSNGMVKIIGAAGALIDGKGTAFLTEENQFVTVQFDGESWWIVAGGATVK